MPAQARRLACGQQHRTREEPSPGADAHYRVNNPTRPAQEVCDRLDAFYTRE
jgi:hypothetical protein